MSCTVATSAASRCASCGSAGTRMLSDGRADRRSSPSAAAAGPTASALQSRGRSCSFVALAASTAGRSSSGRAGGSRRRARSRVAHRPAAPAPRRRARDSRRARRSRPASSSSASISRGSIGASVSVSNALSGFSPPAIVGAFDHQHQVLDADAVGAGFVIAGLVRQDHAALERRGAELGDARRPFVHRQIAADAVAGAVVEVEAGLPTAPARANGSSCAPVVPSGKHRARDGDVALEHAGEAVAHLRGRRADRDGAGDVGGAVLVLRRRNRSGTVRPARSRGWSLRVTR